MNPAYNQGIIPSGDNVELGVFTKPLASSFMSKELHDETIGMYLKAARQNHISNKSNIKKNRLKCVIKTCYDNE